MKFHLQRYYKSCIVYKISRFSIFDMYYGMDQKTQICFCFCAYIHISGFNWSTFGCICTVNSFIWHSFSPNNWQPCLVSLEVKYWFMFRSCYTRLPPPPKDSLFCFYCLLLFFGIYLLIKSIKIHIKDTWSHSIFFSIFGTNYWISRFLLF